MMKRVFSLASNAAFKKMLIRGGIGLGLKGGAAGMQIVMFAAIARAISADDFGTFGFAFSLATIISNIGSLGQRMYALKEGAILSERQEGTALAALARESMFVVVLGTLVASSFIWAVAYFGYPELKGGMAYATALLALGLSIAGLLTHLFRSYRSLVFAFLPRDILWRLAVTIIFVAVPTFFGTLDALSTTLVAGGALLVISVLHLLLDRFARAALRRRVGGYGVGQRVLAAKHLWVTSLLPMIGGAEIVTVLLGLITSPSETGMFFAAFRLSLVMELFSRAADMVVAPMIARFSAADAKKDLQRVLSQSVIAVTVPGLVIFGIILIFGADLLRLMNPGFAAGHAAFSILAFGFLMSIMTGPIPAIMELTGQEGLLMKRMFFTNLGYLVFLLPLIMSFGIIGAAIAVSTLRIVQYVSLVGAIERHLGVTPTILHPFLQTMGKKK